MTSGNDENSKKTTPDVGSTRSRDTPEKGSTPQSRPTKRPVTIDLDAKDVTLKPSETKPATSDKSANQQTKPEDIKGKTATTQATTGTDTTEEKRPSEATVSKTDDPVKKSAPEPSRPKRPEITKNKRSTPHNTTEKPVASVKALPPKTPPPTRKRPDEQASNQPRGGMVSTLFTAIIGGIIAISGLLGLQMADILPLAKDTTNSNLIATLESRIATLEKIPRVNKTDLDILTTRLEQVNKVAEQALSPLVPEEITTRLTALEARLASGNPTKSENSQENSTLTGIDERLAAIEARLSAGEERQQDESSTRQDTKLLANNQEDLSERLTALKNQIEVVAGSINTNKNSESTQVQTPDVAVKLEDLLETVKSNILPDLLSSLRTLETVQKQATDKLTVTDQKIAALSEQQSGIDTILTQITARIAKAQNSVESQSETTTNIRDATTTLALAALEQAVRTGGSFPAALSALESINPNNDDIETIKPFAKSGIRDHDSLGKDLEHLLSEAALKATASEKGENDTELSALEKLVHNARSLIKVRRIGEDTDNTDTPLSAMKTAFAKNNPEAFISHWEGLNSSQKAVFNQWLVEWKGNLSLLALIDKLKNPDTGAPQTPRSE